MGLVFSNAGAERVDIGDNANQQDLTTLTVAMWVYVESTVGNGDIIGFNKDDSGGGGQNRFFQILDDGGAIVEFRVFRARATTSTHYVSNNSPIVHDAWRYVAATFDTGATPVVTMRFGGLTGGMTAATFGTSTNGSGALTTDVGAPWYIGNKGTFFDAGDHTIGWCAMWDRVLTTAEIDTQRFRPHVTPGCIGFYYPGLHGTTTVPDLSGSGNTGTIGGSAAVGTSIPLGAPYGRRRRLVLYDVGPTEINGPAGSITWTAQSGTLARTTAAAATGSVVWTAQSGTLARTTASAATGQVVWTGQAGTLARTTAAAATGQVVWTGVAGTTTGTTVINGVAGSIVYQGQSGTVARTTASSATGSVVWTAQSGTLARTTASAATGSVVWSGSTGTLARTTASAATAALIWSGVAGTINNFTGTVTGTMSTGPHTLGSQHTDLAGIRATMETGV